MEDKPIEKVEPTPQEREDFFKNILMANTGNSKRIIYRTMRDYLKAHGQPQDLDV